MENIQIGNEHAKYKAPIAYNMRNILSDRLGVSVPQSNGED